MWSVEGCEELASAYYVCAHGRGHTGEGAKLRLQETAARPPPCDSYPGGRSERGQRPGAQMVRAGGGAGSTPTCQSGPRTPE